MEPSNSISLRVGRALLLALALGFAATSSIFASSGTRYYVNDHLATTVGIADAAGEIAAMEADAFGSPLAGGGNAARFTGKPYDDDLGAYVFPFRNYRAEEARWMSADPSGFPDGVNGVRYAPAFGVEIDPWGLASVTVYARGSGNSSGSSSKNYGHGWVKVTTDSGAITTAGNYPDGVQPDNGEPESQHTFDISETQAQASLGQIDLTVDYHALNNNCIDMVENVLNASGISHPSFNMLGISWPNRLRAWLNNLE